MSVTLITGSSGLIGSESARFFHSMGMDVVGVDNDLRSYFFGPEASTEWNALKMKQELQNFRHYNIDIRDQENINRLFANYGHAISLIIHAAAQPSHDWAAREPLTDFSVNATGTLNILEAMRRHCPDAVFILMSTNKVYGDTPNRLPLFEQLSRWEIDPAHAYASRGIDEGMSIDQSMHSIFGASKASADLMTQEYGRYFGLKTGTFRGGCLTGPSHSGTELHGFLAYLVKCAVTGKEYTIHGYKGKQVRDNIHSYDLVRALGFFFKNPHPGSVYNIGGSRHINCSMLEAISLIEEISNRELKYTLTGQARAGDHIWWISDVTKFRHDFPDWEFQYDLRKIIKEIVDAISARSQ